MEGLRPPCESSYYKMHMSDKLIAAAKLYHREAGRCLRGRAYLAACVMQGAALEASLQAMCFIFPEAVKRTTVYQRKKRRGFRKKRNRALEFGYAELIDIAAELSWFPPKRVNVWGRRTTLAGFVHELRNLRNYVHGGVLAPKDKPVERGGA
jgi:hypothetical protein